jgi:E3 ubiquitin-protein ligase DOA10
VTIVGKFFFPCRVTEIFLRFLSLGFLFYLKNRERILDVKFGLVVFVSGLTLDLALFFECEKESFDALLTRFAVRCSLVSWIFADGGVVYMFCFVSYIVEIL